MSLVMDEDITAAVRRNAETSLHELREIHDLSGELIDAYERTDITKAIAYQPIRMRHLRNSCQALWDEHLKLTGILSCVTSTDRVDAVNVVAKLFLNLTAEPLAWARKVMTGQ